MEKVLVSVIIPIYNVEAYLEKCVDSVLHQTYKNMEIILVNDGSTDHCLDICRAYEKKDDRIKVVNKENGGLSDARNAGMRVATGTYFYFLDSDDYIKENLVETCVSAMHQSNADLVVFNFEHVNEKGKGWVTDTFPDQFYQIRKKKEKMRFFANVFFEYKCGFEAWNRMYRASVIRKNHLKFTRNRIVFAEDICFNLGYLCCVDSVRVIEDRLHYYRHRSDSIMGQAKKEASIKKYVNIGIFNDLVVKRNSKEQLKKEYYMIYAMLIERAIQTQAFQKRYNQMQQLSKGQKQFHNVMMHRFQRSVLHVARMIGWKKTAKLWVNHLYYLTGSKVLGNILQKIEMGQRSGK